MTPAASPCGSGARCATGTATFAGAALTDKPGNYRSSVGEKGTGRRCGSRVHDQFGQLGRSAQKR